MQFLKVQLFQLRLQCSEGVALSNKKILFFKVIPNDLFVKNAYYQR